MDGPVRTRSTPVLDLWRLEPVGRDHFRGWGRNGNLARLFGGQVAAQALAAAGSDLPPGWGPISLQAYFVREGRAEVPVEYRVLRVDEAVRRVTACQSEQPILILDARFTVDGGVLPPARGGEPPEPLWQPGDHGEAAFLEEQARRMPFDVRFAGVPSRIAGLRGEVLRGQRFWFRAGEPLPDLLLPHACALTYISDLFLVSVALARHGLPGGRPRADIQAASLDHAVWFHRPARADDWVCYEQASPTSAGGRALSTGRLLDAAGDLVATVHQEVLLRA
jgi:acyl-CoA thioesterase-2